MKYTLAVYTDIGMKKAGNQDSLCIRRAATAEGEILFAAICDGMGGLQKGELASAEVIRALEVWFDSNLATIVRAKDFDSIKEQLSHLISCQNDRIAAFAGKTGIQMGSTLTAFLSVGTRYLTVNVGDSRSYQIKTGTAVQLTTDQSLVELEVERGRITADEARHHPQRNVLLQCIGVGKVVKPAFTEGRVENAGLYLLCSDGFTHELTPEQLAQALMPIPEDDSRTIQDKLIQLTEHCKAQGESDNITTIAAMTQESQWTAPKPSKGVFHRFLRTPEPAAPVAVSLVESAHILYTGEEIL